MPEKKLWTRDVGMEALNSVGSTGSCDSIESLSSNHSAFSGEGYDHLSAEERECLMFLEETIESLDNEDDSGLSNDEPETTHTTGNLLVSEPVKIPISAGNENKSTKTPALPTVKELNTPADDINKVSQGHHSFPRVQVPKEESAKKPLDHMLVDPNKNQAKVWPEKPKRKSLINQQRAEESPISDFLILPPPEAFRDPQMIDKRHSVTDPTDARDFRFDKIVFKSAIILENREFLPPLKQSDQKLPPPVYPRVSSLNKFSPGEQETPSQATEKPADTQFKQGPPTAPKPRTLPPHIVIKTSRGDFPNLDPQIRPRTFSAHERPTDKPNESTIINSKEQDKARQEALQKLGLEEKLRSQNNISTFKADLLAEPYGSEHRQKEDKRKSVALNEKDETHSTSSIPVQPLVARTRLSMTSKALEKADSSGTSLLNQKEIHGPISSVKTKPSERALAQEKPDKLTTPALQPYPVPQRIENIVTDVPEHLNKESYSHSDSVLNQSQNIGKNPVKLQTSPITIQASTIPEKNSVLAKTSEQLKKAEHLQENKVGSLENITTISTSPKIISSFSPPKESVVTQHSPPVIRNNGKGRNPVDKSNRHSTHFEIPVDKSNRHSTPFELTDKSNRHSMHFELPVDKSNRHSTHFEATVDKSIGHSTHFELPDDKSNLHSTHLEQPDATYLRLPQGSVPGLRQINIKSNTLERSGVGLSSSLPSIEKGSSSIFKKPLFSANFLRNNRPRPASLGTGKDFAKLEPNNAAADSTEKHSFFSRPARPSAPVTSVKIAPKGSTDEHRRQALKKLGILKE